MPLAVPSEMVEFLEDSSLKVEMGSGKKLAKTGIVRAGRDEARLNSGRAL